MSSPNVNVTALEALPNPFTPLAFLPPTLANQFEVSRYMYLITLGAFMWDLATNLDSDYHLLFKHKIRMPTIVYYFSRISTLTYIITCTVCQIGNVGNCQQLQIALGVFYMLGGSSTTFLFFLRIRAVFHGEKYVVAFFFIAWLAVVAGFFIVPFSVTGAHIGTTEACINTGVKTDTAASVITQIIHDSLVFIAISHRVLSIQLNESNTIKNKTVTFFRSGKLPAVSRALLQGGQQYYLITVGGNIVSIVLVYLPSVPATYRAMFTIPNLALVNCMACIVFRRIKFGMIAADGTADFSISLPSNQTNPSWSWHPNFRTGNITEGTTNSFAYQPTRSVKPVRSNLTTTDGTLEVTKTVEHSISADIPLEVLLAAKRAEIYEQTESRSQIEMNTP